MVVALEEDYLPMCGASTSVGSLTIMLEWDEEYVY
jgi:hypothetical protein